MVKNMVNGKRRRTLRTCPKCDEDKILFYDRESKIVTCMNKNCDFEQDLTIHKTEEEIERERKEKIAFLEKMIAIREKNGDYNRIDYERGCF